jgi:hypothetical protein
VSCRRESKATANLSGSETNGVSGSFFWSVTSNWDRVRAGRKLRM